MQITSQVPTYLEENNINNQIKKQLSEVNKVDSNWNPDDKYSKWLKKWSDYIDNSSSPTDFSQSYLDVASKIKWSTDSIQSFQDELNKSYLLNSEKANPKIEDSVKKFQEKINHSSEQDLSKNTSSVSWTSGDMARDPVARQKEKDLSAKLNWTNIRDWVPSTKISNIVDGTDTLQKSWAIWAQIFQTSDLTKALLLGRQVW